MNLRLLLLLSVFMVALPATSGAREVWLKKGEVYRDRDRDLEVICEGGPAGGLGQPLAVRECQYWDDFAKKCLFEKTIYTFGQLECVEECQHWDSFNSTCDYQSKCTFYPRQEAFVLRTCAEFDGFNHTCLKTRDEKIGVAQ